MKRNLVREQLAAVDCDSKKFKVSALLCLVTRVALPVPRQLVQLCAKSASNQLRQQHRKHRYGLTQS